MTQAKAQHTPGPWTVSHTQDGFKVGRGLDVAYVLGQGPKAEANAEFIVRACNSHADLLAACEAQEAYETGGPNPWGHSCAWCGDCMKRLGTMRRAALAKAREGA